jgi:hypothetical protein
LIGAAITVGIESIHGIVTPHPPPAPYTLIVLAGVLIVKELLFRHVAMLETPSAAWQLGAMLGTTEATPLPRPLLLPECRYRFSEGRGGKLRKFGDDVVTSAHEMGSEPVRTAFRSPWQNGVAVLGGKLPVLGGKLPTRLAGSRNRPDRAAFEKADVRICALPP